MDHVGAQPDAPLTLRVYPGQPGRFTLYQDAGSGTGYEKGQSSLTSITTGGQGASATVAIGPSRGSYPGQPQTRGFDVDMIGLSRPASVLLDGHPLAPGAWTYDPATHTVTVTVTGLARTASAQVTETGGTQVAQAEPAAVDLSIDPSTEHDAGPGDAANMAVTLAAPSGWSVTPSTPASAGTIAAGSSATQSWTVQAPASAATTPVTATLTAQASYTSAGQPELVTAAEQAPPAPAPLPPPVISQVTPSTTTAGSSVTLTGQNFGSTQGTSYLTLAQGGTSWGAPYDGAKLTITSWSDTSITVTLPPSTGSFPLEPGSATITVSVDGQTSNTETITITS
jgi:hypothetical protein